MVLEYLDLMDQLAIALRSHDATDLSAAGLEVISGIAADLEDFSGFFSGLDESQRNDLFGTYGVELRESAEKVANYALNVQERRGDGAISQELAGLPAFEITTTNIREGDPVIEPLQAPAGDISAMLTGDEVSDMAGGVGLSTLQIDMLSRAAAADPTQVEHMVSFDLISFNNADGSQSLSLTAIELDSEAESAAHMALVSSDTPGIQEFSDTIGDSSGFVESNEAGIGSMVVFKKGNWVILLHTAQGDSVAPLVDIAGLEKLARLVADRL